MCLTTGVYGIGVNSTTKMQTYYIISMCIVHDFVLVVYTTMYMYSKYIHIHVYMYNFYMYIHVHAHEQHVLKELITSELKTRCMTRVRTHTPGRFAG